MASARCGSDPRNPRFSPHRRDRREHPPDYHRASRRLNPLAVFISDSPTASHLSLKGTTRSGGAVSRNIIRFAGIGLVAAVLTFAGTARAGEHRVNDQAGLFRPGIVKLAD